MQAFKFPLHGNGSSLAGLKCHGVASNNSRQVVVSIHNLGKKAEGVTIKGLKYELTDAVLTNDFPIGISNEFIGKMGMISVKKGALCCMISYPS